MPFPSPARRRSGFCDSLCTRPSQLSIPTLRQEAPRYSQCALETRLSPSHDPTRASDVPAEGGDFLTASTVASIALLDARAWRRCEASIGTYRTRCISRACGGGRFEASLHQFREDDRIERSVLTRDWVTGLVKLNFFVCRPALN